MPTGESEDEESNQMEKQTEKEINGSDEKWKNGGKKTRKRNNQSDGGFVPLLKNNSSTKKKNQLQRFDSCQQK